MADKTGFSSRGISNRPNSRGSENSNSAVHRRWIALDGDAVLGGVFPRSTLIDGAAIRKLPIRFITAALDDGVEILDNSPHALLSPLEIALNVLCGLDAVGQIGAGCGQPTLRQRLELEQFLGLGVELAGSVNSCVSGFCT